MCREISQYQKKLEELQKSPNTGAKRNINAINACYFSAASKNKGNKAADQIPIFFLLSFIGFHLRYQNLES